MLKHYTLH